MTISEMLLLKTVFPYTNFDDIQISFNFDTSYIDILCICNKIIYLKKLNWPLNCLICMKVKSLI
jgi:hypothetical protein